MLYKVRTTYIEALTFDEFVREGLKVAASVVDGVPWAFAFRGNPVTHERDGCYIVPTIAGDAEFTADKVLIVGKGGALAVYPRDGFERIYERIVSPIEAMKSAAWAIWRGTTGPRPGP